MKFSIVTPVYNMEAWIAETIETVLSQKGDFEIEYIVMSDGSSDRSVEIARMYQHQIEQETYPIQCKKITMQVIEQKNTGMYGAINNGFSYATGDIYAWINADDIYEPGALQAMAIAFGAHPEIEWIKGITATLHEDKSVTPGKCQLYDWRLLKAGVYGMEAYFVEQDSVFWRASLWRKGGPMPTHYRSAGDYWLWLSFAKYAPLWSLNVPVSQFRKRDGQISKGIDKYKREQWEARGARPLTGWIARLFFYPYFRLPKGIRAPLEQLFTAIYPGTPSSYFEIQDGTLITRRARSFIIR